MFRAKQVCFEKPPDLSCKIIKFIVMKLWDLLLLSRWFTVFRWEI